MADLLDLDHTEAREAAYPSQMGRTIGAFAEAAVAADGIAKDAAMLRTITLLKRPNVKWGARVSLPASGGGAGDAGGEQHMTVGASTPAVVFGDLRPFVPETAELTMGMRVSEMNKATDTSKKEGKLSGQAKWGIGLFSISVSMSGSVSNESSRARQTDYSSRCDVKLKMSQGDVPEGVSLVRDTINELVAGGMAVQKALAANRIQALQQQTAAPDPKDTPPDAPVPDPEQDTSGDADVDADAAGTP